MEIIHKANIKEGKPLEKLTWMTERIIESLESTENALLFLVMIQASTSDAIPEEVKEILTGENSDSPVMETIPLILDGQKKGEIIKEDPITLAVTFYAVIQGLAINKIHWDECPLPNANIILKLFKRA